MTVLQQEVPDEANHAAARLAGGVVLHNPAPAVAGAVRRPTSTYWSPTARNWRPSPARPYRRRSTRSSPRPGN
ncbi:hypothetical protein ACR6C2_39825 [Streptomyces sp. INA 01156]